MNIPKILVGTPTYDGKEYCRQEFVDNVKQLTYPNMHWLIVDTSKKPTYYHKLRRAYPGHVERVPRGRNSRDALANASNHLRDKVLSEGYEYLLMLESDLFPPKDIIERLIVHGRPVVGAAYEIGFGNERGLCAFVTERRGSLMGTRRVTREEEKKLLKTGLRKIHGMGVGCVLIHRSILERFPFWYSTADDDRMRGMVVRKHPDVYFYMDLWNAKIPVYLDTNTLIEHRNQCWSVVKDV